ncbi:MAG: prepilin-type N-terminal cleavage/methylation domain-containing protein [Patescibacteria group bacterium]
MRRYSLKPKTYNLSRGFTLIELMVVTGIIAIISGLVLVNNNKFGGAVLLENLAYDMALSLRQAQVYGISVQRFNGAFGAAYGVHFTPSAGGAQSLYVLFADAVNKNGLYDSGELVQSTKVAQGYTVSNLCANAAGSETCAQASALDITFQRPEPDAYIRISGAGSLYESATITVSSPRGDTRRITVYANGQISVQ